MSISLHLAYSAIPMLGSDVGGTTSHLHCIDFGQIDGVPPLCLFSGKNKTSIAEVLISTLIKCRTPPAYAGNKTTIGLSFNGGFDFVLANESFQYIGAVTVEQISPLYVPTSVGTMLTITGNNLIPNGNMSWA